MWFGTCVESFRAVKIKKTAWVNTNLMYYRISIKKLPNEKLGSRKYYFFPVEPNPPSPRSVSVSSSASVKFTARKGAITS